MSEARPDTRADADPSAPILLAYRLTEADVRRYLGSCRFAACKRTVRDGFLSTIPLVVLGVFLVGLCFHGRGMRPGLVALGSTLAMLAAFAWWHDRRSGQCGCRLARDLGIPCDLRLKVSPGGIAKAPGRDPSDPGRAFEWSEVAEARRVRGLFVIRIRPTNAILLIPARAFARDEAIADFDRKVRAWREAARNRPAGRRDG